jgi:lipopolysaccharide/colanic/teichoic acid biosynthesis glycosyltransferase
MKRLIDLVISSIGLILLSPLFLIIGIIINIEDSSGPVFFANRRIGQDGRIFSLYKFRYMYWKYSVKDAYGVDEQTDSALKYEEKLKKQNDMRDGPLYKISNDPRKMRF